MDETKSGPVEESGTKTGIGGYPYLECPYCERGTRPEAVNADGSVRYRCSNSDFHPDFRPRSWTVLEDGSLKE